MDFAALEQRLGVTFRDADVLRHALTHRSYINEHRELGLEHNERLEFLGDAVLELVVTDELYTRYPEKPEGELTALRAALVNTQSLAASATELGVGEYLLLSKGEARDTGRARQFILANTFEAIIGAIYLDLGYETAKDFIIRVLIPKLETIIAERLWQDAKSRFQELAQDQMSTTPHYTVLAERGPDHDKHFTIGVFLGEEKVAEGTGKSKQEAEQAAARAAIDAQGWK